MIKSFVITVMSDWSPQSKEHAKKCFQSIKDTDSQVEPHSFKATTPSKIFNHQSEVWGKPVLWNWPKEASQDGLDFATGIYKKHYVANDVRKVVAAAVSHARLWKMCVGLNEPILVLEEDALFTRKFSYDMLFENEQHSFEKGGVCGLNDPRGATRKAGIYYSKVLDFPGRGVYNIPMVDEKSDVNLASGLAGNSAYVIKPFAAKELLDAVLQYGLWPNDALMCHQLFNWLRVSKPFYTRVQGTVSTTTS